ncbi:protein phosphatase PHLPP-like protein [Limulus polyphemus]|uniref:Protein phosphatase PHLPP-like protein n=1 Tax=Limulus polyphemus TaxID=6850 RepID=A0ABM1TNS7_LIMPO|nr:protein phosphatase PHLPP-like protein [Limulus polyphemus]
MTEGLSHLRHLDISRNKLRGEVHFSRLKNLTYLDVSHNDIESLQMTPLSSLENLNCSYNKLRCITLNSIKLRSVLCHHNELLQVQFPGSLEQLEEFGASHFFKKKRPLLSLVKLGNNQIHKLPELNKEVPLRKLLLENNLLAELPEAFFDYLPRLDELNVTHNQLTDLPLPTSKQNLSLRKLFLSANRLRENVFELLRVCPRLQVLHVGYNLLTKLPDHIFKATPDLQQMSLAGNRLQSIEKLSNVPKLQFLYLHSNKLTTVPNFSSHASLRVLDISCTKLNKVNLAFLVTPDLRHLDISLTRIFKWNQMTFSSFVQNEM